MEEYVVGIDIGSSNICAAVGKKDKHGSLKIFGVTSIESKGVKNGVIIDIENISRSILECINQLSRMIDYKIKNVYVSIPGGVCELVDNKSLVAITSESFEISSKDKERLIEASKLIEVPTGKEIIGAIPIQYLIDGYGGIVDPVGMSGMRLESDTKLIIAQSTVINNLFKSFEKIGIILNGLIYQPIALSRILLSKEEKSLNTAIINIGGETVNISLLKKGKIFKNETILIGGKNITNDVSVCLKLTFDEAEKLKKKYGVLNRVDTETSNIIQMKTGYNDTVEIDYKLLIQIMEARIEEILLLIYEKLNKMYNYDDLSCIIITGGGLSLFDGINEYITSIFKKHVRIGIPDYIGASSPLYSTAIGIIKDATNESWESFTKDNFGDLGEMEIENDDISKEEIETGVINKIKNFFTELF